MARGVRAGAGRVGSGSGPAALALALAALALAAWTGPAAADLRVCNRTTYMLNVALGSAAGDGFRTEGWWSIAANGCQSVIRGPLQSRFVYLYAADIDGRGVAGGDVEMCVLRRSFEIDGIGDCWRRGYEAAGFAEIDTLDFEGWTVFLEEGGRVSGGGP